MLYVDATCPLVSKVHREAERHHKNGRTVVLIGHAGHPEVIGTMGQLPEGAIVLVETVADVDALEFPPGTELAHATQTTLSVDETVDILAALKRRFPAIHGPKMDDICYATTNRQQAVKDIAPRADAFIIVGAPNSSNSKRLVEVAKLAGCPKAMLVQRGSDVDLAWLEGCRTVGLSAGASAPELLVQEVIEAMRAGFDVTVEDAITTVETIEFKLPRVLVA